MVTNLLRPRRTRALRWAPEPHDILITYPRYGFKIEYLLRRGVKREATKAIKPGSFRGFRPLDPIRGSQAGP